MNRSNHILAAVCSAVLLSAIPSADAGELLTDNIVRNARNNGVDPRFANAMRDSTTLGYTVRYIAAGDSVSAMTAKNGIFRAIIDAQEQIPEACFLPDDLASRNLYDGLLSFDLLSSMPGIFTPEERDGIRRNSVAVLDWYLDPSHFNWNDERWCPGIPALRLTAACALFATSFPDDPGADHYIKHAIQYARKNLLDGVDGYGAWVAGPPESSEEAAEYFIIVAKILRNAGYEDLFAQQRMILFLTNGMQFLPPRQPSSIMNAAVVAGYGTAEQMQSISRTVVLAASDCFPQFPDQSSYLVWYWNQCGNPVTPLGILYHDSLIPYLPPSYLSGPAGRGTIVFRDRFSSPDESMLIASFGSAPNIPERVSNMRNDGDFSFIWSGTPLVLSRGNSPDPFLYSFYNQQLWLQSSVFPEDRDLPVIPDMPVSKDAAPANPDFYPDGLEQVMSTGMIDYASGVVRNQYYTPSQVRLTRHFLFIKPDALVIYDETASAEKLDWSIWMPSGTMAAEAGGLSFLTGNGMEMQTVFAGTENRDYTVETQPDSLTTDWPFLMRASWGDGVVTLLTLDCDRILETEFAPVLGQMLENIAVSHGRGQVGLLDGQGTLADLLNRDGMELTTLSDIPAESELLHFATIILHPGNSALYADRIFDAGPALESYIRQGGHLIVLFPDRFGLCAGPSESGILPIPFGRTTLPVQLSDSLAGDDLTITDDTVWRTPHRIPAESVLGMMASILDEPAAPEVFPVRVPSCWSEQWKPLAAIRHTFPMNTGGYAGTGDPLRIRVTQPSEKGLLTLILPRRQGESFSYTVTDHQPNFIAFSDPVSQWEVYAGPTNWSDGRLSVRMTMSDGQTLYWVFDATTVTFGTQHIIARQPFSFYYSVVDDNGQIQSASNNEITFGTGKIKMHAGAISFTHFSGDMTTTRESYLSVVKVSDGGGEPVEGARVFVNDSFAGVTDRSGTLPVPWSDAQPTLTVRAGSSETGGVLVPGEMAFIFDAPPDLY